MAANIVSFIPEQKPQVNLVRSVTARMMLVSVCAGLAVAQSSLTDNGASLMIALAALSGAVASEFLLNFKLQSRTLFDGSAAASALVFTLLLPNTFPPLLAFLGSIFAMTVVKCSFGGLGGNWVNPAIGAWLFARFSWPGAFGGALKNSPFVNSTLLLKDSPLSRLAISGVTTGGFLGEGVVDFLNRTFFSLFDVRLPPEYASLFAPRFPAIIADRGFLGLLAGTVVIIAFQAAKAWTPVVFLGVYVLLVRVFGSALSGGALGNGDILFGVCSGGVIAAAFLVNADPVTAPKSRRGKAAMTVLAAALAFVFRYLGSEPYGAFFAAALVNVLVPLIRVIESRLLYQAEGCHE
jgi:electron transport complex protein RnfD